MKLESGVWTRYSSLVAVVALSQAAGAIEVTVQNDSLGDGDTGAIQVGFVSGESAAAWLTSPCAGTIVAVQVMWLSLTGGTLPSLEDSITIHAQGVFPSPGAALEELIGPVMQDGGINEFRFVDKDQAVPLSIPVQAGQVFVVSFRFTNTPSASNGPSVVTDIDGCQAIQKNAIFALPGGWLNACVLGMSGDFVIRAVIECPNPTGACCLVDGSCQDEVTEASCIANGGTYQGDAITCAQSSCPQSNGACCIPFTGGCLDLSQSDCGIVEGIWQGGGTDCNSVVCFPIGACCLPDGSCADGLSPEGCAAMAGTFQGDGTACTGVSCPEPEGACCLTNGGCIVLTESDCGIVAGSWAGVGTDCTDADQNGTADECETSTCPWDMDADGSVAVPDLLVVLAAWGTDPGGPPDFDGDGNVAVPDLLDLLAHWGACP